jgi:hypothetical protein
VKALLFPPKSQTLKFKVAAFPNRFPHHIRVVHRQTKMKKFSNGKELGATPKSLLESFFFSFIGHMNILLIKGEIPGIQDAYREFS